MSAEWKGIEGVAAITPAMAVQSGCRASRFDAALTVRNLTGETVELFWLGDGGDLNPFTTLKPDTEIKIRNGRQHNWLATEAGDAGFHRIPAGSARVHCLRPETASRGQGGFAVAAPANDQPEAHGPGLAQGTLVDTAEGFRAVETLRPGDMLRTRDRGLQELRWIGSRSVRPAEDESGRDPRPVIIAPGVLGATGPQRALTVAPGHLVMLDTARGEVMFGARECLARASHLGHLNGVTRASADAPITLFDLLFDTYELVRAAGLWCASYRPDEQALRHMPACLRGDLLQRVPRLRHISALASYVSNRPLLRDFEAALVT